ncbi:MAG: PilZ domain-containing protein [Phycisphaerae bacterium]
MSELQLSRVSCVYLREVVRFIGSVGSISSGADRFRNRRSTQRAHRSWPLLATVLDRHPACDLRVILHDISTAGVGFYSETPFSVGTLLGIKLFWSEIDAPRVPAEVRHARITRHGILVGARFVYDQSEACRRIEETWTRWYG